MKVKTGHKPDIGLFYTCLATVMAIGKACPNRLLYRDRMIPNRLGAIVAALATVGKYVTPEIVKKAKEKVGEWFDKK
jgi:hypothetical protein